MKILAADTTTSTLTVALCEGDRVLAESVVDCGRAHAERLLSTVDWVLAEAGVRLEAVDVLAVSAGPGSFTGLRVGVATWKGLALGAGLPLVAVSTLDALTRVNAYQDAMVCPLLDAKMGEVFGAIYRFEYGTRHKCTPDRVCAVEALLEELSGVVTFLGDGSLRYRERIAQALPEAVFIPASLGMPRASAVAGEAAALMAEGCATDATAVAPVYLRKSQAEEARAKAASS